MPVQHTRDGPEEEASFAAQMMQQVQRLADNQERAMAEVRAQCELLRQDNLLMKAQIDSMARGRGSTATERTPTSDGDTPLELVNQLTGRTAAPSDEAVIPVDLLVSDKMKGRIWAHEAIDVGDLVRSTDKKKEKEAEDTDVPLEVRELTPKQWIAAWNIYTAIYLQQHSEAAMGLAVHFQQVNKLMDREGDWQRYDWVYRKFIQHGIKKWGDPVSNLYTDALIAPKAGVKGRGEAQGNKKGGARPSVKYCYEFNNKGACFKYSCQFKHSCLKCHKEGHAAKGCRSTQDRSKGDKTDQSFRSRPVQSKQNK
jgi:hypothetical protein